MTCPQDSGNCGDANSNNDHSYGASCRADYEKAGANDKADTEYNGDNEDGKQEEEADDDTIDVCDNPDEHWFPSTASTKSNKMDGPSVGVVCLQALLRAVMPLRSTVNTKVLLARAACTREQLRQQGRNIMSGICVDV